MILILLLNMVFGFGKGKMEILLNKNDYKPGDMIIGDINLELKKPMQAKELKISFIAEKEYGTEGSKKQVLYQTEKTLGGQGEYYNNVYHFELKIPEEILDLSQEFKKKLTGIALKIYERKEKGGFFEDYYHIRASLEALEGANIEKKVRIKIV